MEKGRRSSQKLGLWVRRWRVWVRVGRGVVEEGATGVGGREGRKMVGMVAREEMMAT